MSQSTLCLCFTECVCYRLFYNYNKCEHFYFSHFLRAGLMFVSHPPSKGSGKWKIRNTFLCIWILPGLCVGSKSTLGLTPVSLAFFGRWISLVSDEVHELFLRIIFLNAWNKIHRITMEINHIDIKLFKNLWCSNTLCFSFSMLKNKIRLSYFEVMVNKINIWRCLPQL